MDHYDLGSTPLDSVGAHYVVMAGVDEDLEHVMLRCPTYEIHRKAVKKMCDENGLEMELRVLCSDPRLHLGVEMFVGNMKLEKIDA